MSVTKRAVNVLQVPSPLSPLAEVEVLHKLQMSAENAQHARFVLDCTSLQTIGSIEFDFLLTCLEEVMKYNGDLRLAKLSPMARANLTNLGIAHLFEVFETTENAVHSYQVRPTSMAPLNYVAEEFVSDSKYAA